MMRTLFLLSVILIPVLAVPQEKIVWKKAPGGRIIDGEVARASQFPYAAAVLSTYDNANFFCGGTIISNQWILTAAQCIAGATQIRLQMGSNKLDGSDPDRVIVATSTYTVHPDYNPDTFEHDIALIRLRLPIDFNEYISAINLPERAVTVGANVTAIGWGQETDEDPGIVTNLKYVPLVTVSNDQCKIHFGGFIFPETICAVGQLNHGTCHGDSGGPLIEYRTERDAVLVGLSTFMNSQGCETTMPSAFIRIYPYIAWMNSVMSG